MTLRLGDTIIAGSGANQDLSNLTSHGKNIANWSSNVTNCITEAPNGTLTRSGNVVTAKSGLSYISANGRNTDGTLKWTTTTFSSDTSVTIESSSTSDGFIIALGNTLYGWWNAAVFEQEYEPTGLSNILPYSAVLWYRPSTNVWYYLPINSSSPYSWQPNINTAILGSYKKDGTTSIQSLVTAQCLDLLSRANTREISGWSMPSSRYIDLTLGASGTTYTAPANGYFSFCFNPNNVTGYAAFVNASASLGTGTIVVPDTSYEGTRTSIYCSKGQNVILYYGRADGVEFRFIFSEGENV